MESRFGTKAADPEPQFAQRGDRPHVRWVLAPRLGGTSTDGGGPEGGQPAVIGGGSDRHLRPEPVEETGPIEPAQAVLDGAFGQAGEAYELAGGEHLVLAE